MFSFTHLEYNISGSSSWNKYSNKENKHNANPLDWICSLLRGVNILTVNYTLFGNEKFHEEKFIKNEMSNIKRFTDNKMSGRIGNKKLMLGNFLIEEETVERWENLK